MSPESHGKSMDALPLIVKAPMPSPYYLFNYRPKCRVWVFPKTVFKRPQCNVILKFRENSDTFEQHEVME